MWAELEHESFKSCENVREIKIEKDYKRHRASIKKCWWMILLHGRLWKGLSLKQPAKYNKQKEKSIFSKSTDEIKTQIVKTNSIRNEGWKGREIEQNSDNKKTDVQ